jgi:Calcineurin-like phosphoesterase
MKRDFVISDVHGMFFELVRLLSAVDFDPAKDTITVLGDYIDRGSCSREVLQFFKNLKKDYGPNIVLLKGNHEDMCVQAHGYGKGRNDNAMSLWMANGGNDTIKSFQGKLSEETILFIDSLPLFHETDEFIFVHAGVNPALPLGLNHPDTLLWERTPAPHYSGKTVVVGHTIHENVTFYRKANTLCIDTGACRAGFVTRGRLSIVDLTNSKVHWITTGGQGECAHGVQHLELSPCHHHCVNN